MKNAILTILILLMSCFTFISCVPEKDVPPAVVPEYIVFGEYYGYCIGPKCISIYKAMDGKAYMDTVRKYPDRSSFYTAKWELLPKEMYSNLNSKLFEVPANIYKEVATVFGQPDSHDQGGTYLETYKNGIRRFWYFDNDMDSNPAYMRDYLQNLRDIVVLMKK